MIYMDFKAPKESVLFYEEVNVFFGKQATVTTISEVYIKKRQLRRSR